jgi:hypothetical protein
LSESVYCSTLLFGHIYSYEAGKSVTWNLSFPTGWHHFVASKSRDCLKLYVDGELVNETTIPDFLTFNLNSSAPMKIGSGNHGSFKGNIKEVRIYKRILKEKEIKMLSKKGKPINEK